MIWDISWLELPKTDVKYREGYAGFIELAFQHSAKNNKMSCPCRDCKNKKWLDKDIAHVHLLTKGMHKDYRLQRWHLHNEPRQLPPPPRNDTDISDEVFHGGAEYRGLLSSLNPVDEGSSIPFEEALVFRSAIIQMVRFVQRLMTFARRFRN